jgi:glycosyltransferase involved in cell wall biosynthesis
VGNLGLKILHAILSEGFYGSERYCIDLAIAQARGGHDVIVIGEGRDSPRGRQFRKAVAEGAADGELRGKLRLAEVPRGLPAWLQRPAAAAMLIRVRPDVVHTHLNPAARRVGGVAQRLRIPHVMTLHLEYNPREHASIDALIALTNIQHQRLPPEFSGEVQVIWNWLPSQVETALERVGPADVLRLRERWRADEDTVVFGRVGRLVPEKGVDILIRAFRKAFAAADESVRLIIVGEGDQRNALERLAGEDRRIVFVGVQEDIAPYYRAFEVFVSAARVEPFGIAIIEAMAAGCRLVATRIRSTVEIVGDQRVIWAEPESEPELARQLIAAAAAKRERYSYDISRFTPARAAGEIEDFYRRVTSRR